MALAACSHESILNFLGSVEVSLLTLILKSLLMGTSNASELALQVQNSLELDQASLKQPGPKTKIVIRFLARNAKLSDKKRIFVENTGENAAGSTGELALFTPMVFISEYIANLKHH